MAAAQRNGNRKKRESFCKRVPDLGYYFIVTDTEETEENYMKGLRNALPAKLQGRIVIKVSKAKTDDLVRVCREQAAMAPQYGEPWIVFDRDRVTNFDKIIETAKGEGIKTGWSNPCIEIWFDAYFEKMRSWQNSVSCCRGFSEIFENRTGQEYKKSHKEIYGLLKRYGNEAQAIERAKTRHLQYLREGEETPSKMCPCTTLYELIGEIADKVER